MAAVPEFDPNQPFEKVSEPVPEFDPNQPFTKVSSAEAPTMIDKVKSAAQPMIDSVKQIPGDIADTAAGAGAALGQIGRNIPVLGPLAVKAGSGAAALMTKATPDSVLPPEMQGKSLGELYDTYQQQDQNQQAQDFADHPLASSLGAATGSMSAPGLGIVGNAAVGGADTAARGGSIGDIATSAAVAGGLSAVAKGVPLAKKATDFIGDTASSIAKSETGQALGALAKKTAHVVGVGGMMSHSPTGMMIGAAGVAADLAKIVGPAVAKTLESSGIKLDNLIGSQWLKPLAEAAARGPQAVAAAHYVMSQKDPFYQAHSNGDDPAE